MAGAGEDEGGDALSRRGGLRSRDSAEQTYERLEKEFFEGQLLRFVRKREELFFGAMMETFRSELQSQVDAAMERADRSEQRLERSERDRERMAARLSRHTKAFEEERREFYRQILALRELLRRAGVQDDGAVRAALEAIQSAGGRAEESLAAATADAMNEEVVAAARRATETARRKADEESEKLRRQLQEETAKVQRMAGEEQVLKQRIMEAEERLVFSDTRIEELSCVAKLLNPSLSPSSGFCDSLPINSQRRIGSPPIAVASVA